LRTNHLRRTGAVIMVLAITTLGVGAAGVPSAFAASPDPYAFGVPHARVVDAERALDGIVRRVQRASKLPGIAVAVVDRGRVVKAAGYGTTALRHGRRVDADTAFELASLSKPIGATVIARAVDAGTVAWTDPIVDHLPNFALSDPYVTTHVTIEDMYAHRSGLPDHAGDRLADLGFDGATIRARLRDVPLGPFRAQYAYTNTGIDAAADAVAAASGTTWSSLSRRLLYRPLGMTRTTSRAAASAQRPNRATPHVLAEGRWVVGSPRATDAEMAATGVSSSARDVGRWLALLSAGGTWHGRRLLSRAQVANLEAPRILTGAPTQPAARPSQYSLGFDVDVDSTGRVRLGHSGASPLGVGTAFSLSPATGVGIAVLTNGAPVGAAEAITAEFMDRALVGHSTRDWYAAYHSAFTRLAAPARGLGDTPPGDPQPGLADRAYVGTYTNDFYGPLHIVERDGGLVMQLGPEPQEFPLRHWTLSTFAYLTRGERATGRQPVTFTQTDGRVTAVTVGDLDAADGGTAHLGVFRRTR
jgi:CubicO group peptidase (beta-lactamase class C family)